MKKLIYFFLALQFTSTFAGIEQYFKKIENKDGNHRMDCIDFIYMINLDKRPEKYQKTMSALAPYGISPYRFSAVNGWELSEDTLSQLGVKVGPNEPPILYPSIATVFRHEDGIEYNSFEIIKEENVAYYCHSLSRGAIGCYLSHLSILQDAYDSGYETIWIMEDDIRVVRNPHELSKQIKILNRKVKNWDILFTDPEMKDGVGKDLPCTDIRPRPNFQVNSVEYYRKRQQVTKDINKIGMRFGSASMIIKRSGMKKILDFVKTYKIYFPYDIDYAFPPGIKIYACSHDIVSNICGGTSDNGSPTY